MENLTIDRVKLKPWAFTVKLNGNVPSEFMNYQKCLEVFEKYGHVKDLEYERDSKGKGHIHGIVLFPKGFYLQRVINPLWHTHFKEIYSETGWINYINKKYYNNKEINKHGINLFSNPIGG